MHRGLVGAIAASMVLLAPGVAGADPLLTNNPSCVPNPLLHLHNGSPVPPAPHGHPPVILVHGTSIVNGQEAWMDESFTTLAPALAAAGYCPWIVNYPTNMSSHTVPPDTLRSFVTDVLADTGNGDGTGQVSMIGHSQGGMQIRHMLQHYPTAPVRDAISLAGSHKGSASPGSPVCTDLHLCPDGFAEQVATSAYYDDLNPGCADGGPLDDMDCWAPAYGAADYTNVVTMTDELLFPYWRGLMGPYPAPVSGTPPKLFRSSADVTDVVLQLWCPAAHADHVSMLTDPYVLSLILDALGRNGPADATAPCASEPQV